MRYTEERAGQGYNIVRLKVITLLLSQGDPMHGHGVVVVVLWERAYSSVTRRSFHLSSRKAYQDGRRSRRASLRHGVAEGALTAERPSASTLDLRS